MAWVISIAIDPDKTSAPAVGSATATFTDTDSTTFIFAQRASMTGANADAFVSAAIAAKNAWISRKTTETNAENTLVTKFTAAGEAATAAPAV